MCLFNLVFLAANGGNTVDPESDSGKIMATDHSYFSFIAETDSIRTDKCIGNR